MDRNRPDNNPMPPVRPSHATPPTPPSPPAPPVQPQPSQQPPAALANAEPTKPKGRSTLFKVLVGLALLSVASVVLLVGLVVIAASTGVFDSDDPDSIASSPVTTAGAPAADPVMPDGVNITWEASPSSCDGNNKRSFRATMENGTSEALDVRMRILDLSNNFIHQSHVYTAPASGQVLVDLGGIPSGESIVQIIDESNDQAISQTTIVFENC